MSITTFNLYNLFEVVQTASGPSSSQALSTKIAKLVLALRYELLLPHILDHILVSPALMTHFTAVDVLHFNTAHPEIYQSDPNTACRASDHDPLETRFTFNAGAS